LSSLVPAVLILLSLWLYPFPCRGRRHILTNAGHPFFSSLICYSFLCTRPANTVLYHSILQSRTTTASHFEERASFEYTLPSRAVVPGAFFSGSLEIRLHESPPGWRRSSVFAFDCQRLAGRAAANTSFRRDLGCQKGCGSEAFQSCGNTHIPTEETSINRLFRGAIATNSQSGRFEMLPFTILARDDCTNSAGGDTCEKPASNSKITAIVIGVIT
jgi:hypothetical protein